MDRSQKVRWNPFSSGYFADPYPHLQECRVTNPIQIGTQNCWTLFKYKHISPILRSKDFEVSDLSEYLKEKEDYIFKSTSACPHLSETTRLWPMYLNGELHKVVRHIMGKAFSEINFQRYIEEAVDKTNHRFSKVTAFNISDYCDYYIYDIVKQAFDLQKMSQKEMTTYSNLLGVSQDVFVPKQVYQKVNDQMNWARHHFQLSKFKIDLMKLLAEKNMKKDDESIYSIMSISTMAAFETSKDNLTMALIGLLSRPQLIEFAMETKGSSLELLIEELFRFSSPLQFTIRVNKEAIELDGNLIPANSKLYLSVASANRDEEVFLNANEIIPTRTPNDHLAFGGGVHFCLGASVARAELRTCLIPMLSLLRNFQLDRNSLCWNKQIFMRALKTATVHKLN